MWTYFVNMSIISLTLHICVHCSAINHLNYKTTKRVLVSHAQIRIIDL